MGNTVNNITNIYGAAPPMIGEGKIWMAATEPAGWKLANGQAISRTAFPEAFAALGTTYGEGDGSTTFNLPDLRDRTLLGASETHALGSASGSNSLTLTRDKVPGVPVHTTISGSGTIGAPVVYLSATGGGPAGAAIYSITEPADPNRSFINGPDVPAAIDTTPANLAVNFLVYVGGV